MCDGVMGGKGEHKGPEASEHVVYHTAPAVREPAFGGMYGPRLPDVEDTEENKGHEKEGGIAPRGIRREGAEEEHGYPLADKLVDNDTARVFAAEEHFGSGSGQRSQYEDNGQNGKTCGQAKGQEEEGRKQGGKERTRRARSFGGKPGRVEPGKVKYGFIKESHANSKGQRFFFEDRGSGLDWQEAASGRLATRGMLSLLCAVRQHFLANFPYG